MDINQIRTFLAVVQTGSFVGAAETVHVTQSTVSVRMRTLEDELGVALFGRGKKGAVLTAAGQKFLRTASAMAQLWEQAKLDAGIVEQSAVSLRIGAQVSLWQGYLTHWLGWMEDTMPDAMISASMADPLTLSAQLTDGALDAAVMYRPQYRPGFRAVQIFSEEVILVSSLAPGDDPFGKRYVLTYWGPDFQEDHALNFPSQKTPRLSVDLGTIAIDYLLERPAAAYFPRRIASPYLKTGQLRCVDTAPGFLYPAYVVLPESLEPSLSQTVLNGLNEVAQTCGIIP